MENDINLHIVLASGWIKKGNQFLLGKRKSDDPQSGGDWALFGGKCENDLGSQIIENTLKREIFEESGVVISENIKYISSQSFIRSSGHHVIGLIFLTEYKSGQEQVLDGHEDVKWFSIEEVHSLLEENKKLSYLKESFEIIQNMK